MPRAHLLLLFCSSLLLPAANSNFGDPNVPMDNVRAELEAEVEEHAERMERRRRAKESEDPDHVDEDYDDDDDDDNRVRFER